MQSQTTPIIRIRFDRDKLREAVTLLRGFAGVTGEDAEQQSASDAISEVLTICDALNQRGEAGPFFKVDSRVLATERAGESETWVVLEVSDLVKKHLSAVGIGA